MSFFIQFFLSSLSIRRDSTGSIPASYSLYFSGSLSFLRCQSFLRYLSLIFIFDIYLNLGYCPFCTLWLLRKFICLFLICQTQKSYFTGYVLKYFQIFVSRAADEFYLRWSGFHVQEDLYFRNINFCLGCSFHVT